MRSVASDFAREAWALLEPHVGDFAAEEPEKRTDAKDNSRDALRALMARLHAAAQAKDAESAQKLVDAGDKSGTRLIDHSKREFKRLGIDIRKDEPKFGGLITRWRKQNVSLIKSMKTDRLERVEELLRNNENMRVETLTKKLREQFTDVTPNQAETIARTQVLQLHAQITQERQQAAGVEEFWWTTSNDERVRHSHKVLDGKLFRYDTPPVVDGVPTLPGVAPNCRCVPYPRIPELESKGLN